MTIITLLQFFNYKRSFICKFHLKAFNNSAFAKAEQLLSLSHE
ncbi:hypothetical protein DDD_2565 [Nonlabens dokdonensis DSW-6]|uniref:Uncharacterized protein n=1 Tax=Nonlabens dokdonensis (strain DSM 17205 / KCTC 12402 / DSW-6) TaxID=592029 RepID=L7WBT7_NONDD|nr:hypothetical protein DDD_2565 [Nonlabens dokdonensis DSW-6]